jgi:opacity protein-like surface antigen
MTLAVRFLCTFAVALVMAPTLHADGTVTPNVKQDESAVTAVAPTVSAQAETEPGAALTVPAQSSTGERSQAGSNAGPVGATHRWYDSKHDIPKVEWYLGYSFWRAMPTSFSNRMGYLQGGSTSVVYNLNRYFALAADFGGYDNSRLTLFSPTGSTTVDSNGSANTYAVGPRFSYRKYERFTPFVQALFGGTLASAVKISGCAGTPSCTPLRSENAFAAIAGTGLDLRISHHVALRIFEGDFLLTDFRNPISTGGQERGWQKNARFSTGIVFRFGG